MPLAARSASPGFLREQVLTARNIRGNPIVDLLYGGLNYQIEHHLFPTMPRCNLRKAQPIVEAFCRDLGIGYHSTGLFASYREILAHLHRESASLRGARMPAQA
jgi:fatty acid desaturase